MTFYIILALSSFLISLLGTRLVILALRKRTMLIDRPNARSNHKTPTPRGGGLAVVMAIIICLLVADMHYALVLSLLILAAVSLLDDLISVPAWVRLLVQILAVCIGLSTIHQPVFGGFLPPLADKILVGILWIWFINLFNFMDGIDGISATEMISIGLGLSLCLIITNQFPSEMAVYGLIIAAAGFGFWWNWHPARIFLGDVGSIPIGFILAYLLLKAALAGYGYAAVILPAYYLADSGITLVKRIAKKQKIWVAHSKHYYQIAVRHGRSHDDVVRYIATLNMLLTFLAVRSVIDPDLGILHVSVAYFSVFMLLGFFAHSHPHRHD